MDEKYNEWERVGEDGVTRTICRRVDNPPPFGKYQLTRANISREEAKKLTELDKYQTSDVRD